MSISSAFANARSGLALNARAAELVGSNIANAQSANHARQDIVANTMQTGGVGVGQIVRASDPIAMASRLSALGGAEASVVMASGTTQIANLMGSSDGSVGLAASLNKLGIALSQAAVSPDNQSAAQSVVTAAQQVGNDFNDAANGLRDIRNQADASIAGRIDMLNDRLGAIDALNADIVSATARRENTAALEQERDGYIVDITQHIPVSVINRGDGQIALFSSRGAALLDGAPTEFGFKAAGVVADDASVADGTVSGLTMNGLAIDHGPKGLLAGGGLSADFVVRDVTVPGAQASLDELAAGLLVRLESADATLAAYEGGILSDAGSAYNPGTSSGLAARIGLNPALSDPATSVEHLKSGLGSRAADSSNLLSALTTSLTRKDADLVGSGDPSARDIAGHAASISGNLHVTAYRAEEASTTAAARSLAADATHAQRVGVDSDQQLQQLLQIENAYAANARVIAIADAMMQQLLEL